MKDKNMWLIFGITIVFLVVIVVLTIAVGSGCNSPGGFNATFTVTSFCFCLTSRKRDSFNFKQCSQKNKMPSRTGKIC